jgi:hypothetical protein
MCSCIKKVRSTLKNSNTRRGNQGKNEKESRAIAICVRTVLQKKRGRTLKRFSCRNKPMLETQALKN